MRAALSGRTRELERLAVELYARGLSTRDIEDAFTDETGRRLLSRAAVSEITERLWAEYGDFCKRDLSERAVVYRFVDGIAERLRPGQRREAVLAAWGVGEDGRKALLGLMAGSKEDVETVRAFFQDLRARGLGDPLLIVSDGAPGIIRAIEECFPRSARQRCLAHRMRNLAAKVHTDLWPEFKTRVSACYQAPSRAGFSKTSTEAFGVLLAQIHGGEKGAPSYPPVMMFKTILLQQWHNLSDPAAEEAVRDRLSFRRFCSLPHDRETPDHSSIWRFRQAIAALGLSEALLAERQPATRRARACGQARNAGRRDPDRGCGQASGLWRRRRQLSRSRRALHQEARQDLFRLQGACGGRRGQRPCAQGADDLGKPARHPAGRGDDPGRRKGLFRRQGYDSQEMREAPLGFSHAEPNSKLRIPPADWSAKALALIIHASAGAAAMSS